MLATYNPETNQQARKATGSFYTPREIVDYMVAESIKQYLYQQCPNINKAQIDALISDKISDKNPQNNFDKQQCRQIVQAIDNIKIIDPAVGSGAFPMGILQRCVSMLNTIDPINEFYKQQQINKAKEIPDEASQKAAIKSIEEVFSKANQHNAYGKKLYLIEKCIYGVDIQPIAIQICKLRFFISLTIEQNTNKNADDNYGIHPLPNLETKFIAANSLIGIKPPKQANLYNIKLKEIEEQLREIRRKYFNAKTFKDKKEYKTEDENLRQAMSDILIKDGWDNKTATKIAKWDLYNQNAIADWFDAEWQFGVKDDFDIVIGNPPYIRHERIKALKPQLKDYEVFTGTADIYTYFYEHGINALNKKGHLCFITSNTWMRTAYGEKLRAFFLNNTSIEQIIDFGDKSIFDAIVNTNILLCKNQPPSEKYNFYYGEDIPVKNKMAMADLSSNIFLLIPKPILELKKKIESKGTPLKDWDINICRGLTIGYNEAFIIDSIKRDELIKEDMKSAEILKPLLRGRNIKAYKAKWAGLWLINTHNGYKDNERINIDDYPAIKKHLKSYYKQLEKRQDKGYTPYNLRSCAYLAEFEKEKIMWKIIGSIVCFLFDDKGYFCPNSACIMTGKHGKYLTAILNSKIGHYLLQDAQRTGMGDLILGVQALNPIYIPLVTSDNKPLAIKLESLVNKIITAKKKDQNTNNLESEINAKVYKLYELTKEEIKLIESIKK